MLLVFFRNTDAFVRYADRCRIAGHVAHYVHCGVFSRKLQGIADQIDQDIFQQFFVAVRHIGTLMSVRSYEYFQDHDSLQAVYVKRKYRAREFYQAYNIKQILNEAPNQKLIVFCGFSHLFEEQAHLGKKPWMAEILREIAGVDPLTVDQYYFSDLDYSWRFKAPLSLGYYAVGKKDLLKFDSSNFSQADIYVYNNFSQYPYSRFKTHEKSGVFDLNQFISTFRRRMAGVLSLYPENEVKEGSYMPAFHCIVQGNFRQVPEKVYLPKGRYVLTYKTKYEVLHNEVVEVK